MLIFFSIFFFPWTVMEAADVIQVLAKRISVYKYPLQKTVTTKNAYQECVFECLRNDQCEIVGFKEEDTNNEDVLCSFFLKQTCHLIAATNILIDPDTSYFRRVRVPLKAPYDCSDVIASGFFTSGVYTVYPDWSDSEGIRVYCDMETDGGGWMTFQRRMDGSVDFDRNWEEFKNGFGNISGEYWLGNEVIHKFTNDRTYKLRIDLADWEGNTISMNYMTFNLADETDCYKLTSTGYSGEITYFFRLDYFANTYATWWQIVLLLTSLKKSVVVLVVHNRRNISQVDEMAVSNGRCFTTKDRDYDSLHNRNCAVEFFTAWWHNDCFDMSLNGPYVHGGVVPPDNYALGIVLRHYEDYSYSFKFAEMKMRIHEC